MLRIKYKENEGGLSPEQLLAVGSLVAGTVDVHCELITHATVEQLRRGSILFVESVALKNAQNRQQYEDDPVSDSHLVMVEAIHADHLVVINPDTALDESGNGFKDKHHGRMQLPFSELENVWKSRRVGGTITTKAALVLTLAGPSQ